MLDQQAATANEDAHREQILDIQRYILEDLVNPIDLWIGDVRGVPSLTTGEAAILGLLAIQPWTTYELATQLQRSLRWFWPLGERTIYDLPKALVGKGLAASEEKLTGKRTSTVYFITADGERALRRWLDHTGSIPRLEIEDLVKVFFAPGGSLEQLARTIEHMREAAFEAMSELAEVGAGTADYPVDGAIAQRVSVNAVSFELVFRIHSTIFEWTKWAQDAINQWPSTTDPRWDEAAGVFAAANRHVHSLTNENRVHALTIQSTPGSPTDEEITPTLLAVVAHPDDETFGFGSLLRQHRPDVVVTLDPTGSDGHRDHAAVGAAATDAFHNCVTWDAALYHWCLPRSLMQAWSQEIASRQPDSVYLETDLGRPDDDITTVVESARWLAEREKAISKHHTQSSPFEGLPEPLYQAFFTEDHLVRIVPPWEGGPTETSLLGLRH